VTLVNTVTKISIVTTETLVAMVTMVGWVTTAVIGPLVTKVTMVTLVTTYLLMYVGLHVQCMLFLSYLNQNRKVVTSKVKFTLEQAMKAQRGRRGIALLFL
jgi:hypothetical protein